MSIVALLLGQEPEGGGPQPGGGRGGRGGARAGRGAASTREFLGLGTAPDPAEAKKGEPLYKQNCATCHGENARGSQGPNLVRSVMVLHDEKDEEIGPVIKNGRPQGGMPPFPQLSPARVVTVAFAGPKEACQRNRCCNCAACWNFEPILARSPVAEWQLVQFALKNDSPCLGSPVT
jgi:mono/diheme cytochrome c family protein